MKLRAAIMAIAMIFGSIGATVATTTPAEAQRYERGPGRGYDGPRQRYWGPRRYYRRGRAYRDRRGYSRGRYYNRGRSFNRGRHYSRGPYRSYRRGYYRR
jgi:hypothetical protein